jgi:hypothetical protein
MRRRSLVLLLVAIGFAGFVFYALLGYEPVKLSKVQLVRTSGQVSVHGEVHNTGEDTGPFQIEVRYYDRAGHALGNDTVALEGLRHGDATQFSSPPRADRGVADFSIYLNHGRNPYGN